jgi:glycine dehydrogenase
MQNRTVAAADQIASDIWERPCTREASAFPGKDLHAYKFWPHMGRVDNVFGGIPSARVLE